MRGQSVWRRSAFSACLGLGLSGFALLSAGGSAIAQTAPTGDPIKVLQDEITKLQRALNDLKAAQTASQAESQREVNELKASQAASQQVVTELKVSQAALVQGGALKPAADGEHGFLEHKKGDALTFYVPRGEITAYGQFDISVDYVDKGIKEAPNSSAAVGRLGYLLDESTNISFLGVRGFERLGDNPVTLVYQVETQVDFVTNSGTPDSNSAQSNAVKGALSSRNTFLGFSSPTWGAIKFGKTDTPYKNSTARMNPFSGELGDYSVVMGNSGGDNRVEFGVPRLEHSIWYESPNVAGFNLNVLYSPGQNRASDSDNIAAGASDCSGGNIPGSGGTGVSPLSGLPVCNDGGFSDAVSASVSYEHGPLYLAGSYERHQKVNRSSDITGQFADITTPGSVGNRLFNEDVADEDAWKIGIQYKFPTKTTVSAIFEDLHRYLPSELAFQNERQRTGYWLALSQQVTDDISVHLGWAHANRAPGDPGQHNSAINTPPGGTPGVDATGGAGVDNSANMVTAALKYELYKDLTFYIDGAATLNGPFAHFDLGAGGRGVTTDCHDAFGAAGGQSPNSVPHCFTGTNIVGFSTGMAYRF